VRLVASFLFDDSGSPRIWAMDAGGGEHVPRSACQRDASLVERTCKCSVRTITRPSRTNMFESPAAGLPSTHPPRHSRTICGNRRAANSSRSRSREVTGRLMLDGRGASRGGAAIPSRARPQQWENEKAAVFRNPDRCSAGTSRGRPRSVTPFVRAPSTGTPQLPSSIA